MSLLILFVTTAMCVNDMTVSERGAQRFGDLVKLAEHSACARSAVEEMHLQCTRLDESARRTLALRLLSCHLQSSGRQPLPCGESAASAADQIDCVRTLSDVSFNLFTQFHIETESICFHVASELRQERSMRTIALLHDASALAAARLETIVNSTNALSTSLMVITDLNRHVDQLTATRSFPGWVTALLTALVITSPTRTSAARVPCVALLSLIAYAEWRFDDALKARTALELGGGGGMRIVLPISLLAMMRVLALLLGVAFVLLANCVHGAGADKSARVLDKLERAFAQYEERSNKQYDNCEKQRPKQRSTIANSYNQDIESSDLSWKSI